MKFIKNNKLLFSLFLVCICIMLKNSSIPYLYATPQYIKYIFNRPNTSFYISIGEFGDKFATAYATSFIFYYIVNYKLECIRANKVKKIIEPSLENIYTYMGELIEIINISCDLKCKNKEESIASIDMMNFKRVIFLNKKMFKNNNYYTCFTEDNNILEKCNLYKNNILKECEKISMLPNFIFCEDEIINVIAKIKLSHLLSRIPNTNDSFIRLNINIEYNGLGKAYFDFKRLYNELSLVISNKITFKYIMMTENEIREYLNRREQYRKEHPEIAALYKD